MGEVQFTIDEVADILELSHRTVLRYIQGGAGEDKKFPRAYLPHGSRRKGYRIPANDVLDYARREGEWLVLRVERAIRQRQQHENHTLQAV